MRGGSRFLLGTDQRQPATGSADWAEQQSRGWSRGARAVAALWWSSWVRGHDRGSFPAGVGHAVPAGEDRAVCGRTDLYVWQGRFNARSRVVSPCPTCVLMTRHRDETTSWS